MSFSSSSGDNMALASDTLFDKFGLFENAVGSNLIGSPTLASNSLANDNFNFNSFEDLDFADLLEIKEEPMVAASNIIGNTEEMNSLDNNMDPFFMDSASPILDDASLDSIKSDCMWSSVNLWNNIESMNMNSNSRKRRRDVSLTLSECAEGLLAINHLDVNMLDSDLTDVKPNINNPTLGSSPSFMSSSFGALDEQEDESLTSEASENESEDEEEIIDVVSTDLVGSSARTRLPYSSRKTQNHSHIAKPEAGRSLLKKQFQSSSKNVDQKENSASNNKLLDSYNMKQTSILADHCYFLTTRPIDQHNEHNQTKSQIKGMLTPNESSEDEEENSSLFSTATPTIMTTQVDKRKIAQAVQSLMKNRNEPVNSNIKFKFRMKFKSTMAAAHTLKKAAIANQHHRPSLTHQTSALTSVSDVRSSSQLLSNRERRKSASKNAFCPPPNSTTSPSLSSSSSASSLKSSPAKKSRMSSNNHQPSPPSGSSLLARNKSDSEKCREIRDLHNSMERQRRVEQRNHLAYLKKQVPEVADVEKASKLTILRKAMEYCHMLATVDSRVRKERERELNRNSMLKKKLLELSQKLDSRRVTHSGRVASGWNLSRY